MGQTHDSSVLQLAPLRLGAAKQGMTTQQEVVEQLDLAEL
jgi:hypothetical protein